MTGAWSDGRSFFRGSMSIVHAVHRFASSSDSRM
jgi:hypothetical protein